MTVIGKRFRSVFVASIASMSISYILILTDNIVAGQFIGDEAVAAMTLVAPITLLIVFLAYMIADGLAMMFSYSIGRNDRDKANKLFGMGTTASIVAGVLATLILVLFREEILAFWEISPTMMTFADEYYRGLMFIPLPSILNIFFYTIYIAEGEENVCVKASIAMFVVNVILDIVLGKNFGVIGIGIATTIGNLVSFLFHLPYLFSKNCQLRFVKYWNGKEFWQGIFYSWYHSMDTLFQALLPLLLSMFVLAHFSEAELILVTVNINLLTLLITIYTGIVDCMQPMICQYHAEGALYSVRKTMRLAVGSTVAVTLLIILFGMIFAYFLPGLFGVKHGEVLYNEAIICARVFLPFTIFMGVTLMFSNYYIYVERLNLGALIKFLLLLVLPSVGMFAGTFGVHWMWVGIGCSFIVTLLLNKLLTRNKFGLLLMDTKLLRQQFSFDTNAAPENLSVLMKALEKYFSRVTLDDGRKRFLATLTEEIFKIYAARSSLKKFQLEVTIIPAADLTMLIFRDNGASQNPLDTANPFVRQILDNVREKNYMISGDENKFVIVI